jgi:hypothetical protein
VIARTGDLATNVRLGEADSNRMTLVDRQCLVGEMMGRSGMRSSTRS